MVELINDSLRICDVIKSIEQNKYIIPAFQRDFEWDINRIEALWDSILSDYPISNFLFWELDSNVEEQSFLSFFKKVYFNSAKQAKKNNIFTTIDVVESGQIAVLDGQQRLTALFVSLLGTTYVYKKYKKENDKEEYELVIELDGSKIENTDNSKNYDIRFTNKYYNSSVGKTLFKVKNILSDKLKDEEEREKYFNEQIKYVPEKYKEEALNILNNLYNKVNVDKIITYTKLSNIGWEYALEVFIRFNSGGKQLKKSDITMSILSSYWQKGDIKNIFNDFLGNDFKDYGNDFVIRTALMLYGDVAKSTINNEFAKVFYNKRSDFKIVLSKLANFLRNNNIAINRFSGSWNVLIPIIYVIDRNMNWQEYNKELLAYLIRSIIFKYFSSGTTNKLQDIKKKINDNNYAITIELLDSIEGLKITNDKIETLFDLPKEANRVEQILYYLTREYLHSNAEYDIDHLHPRSRFDGYCPSGIEQKDWEIWRNQCNKLPNLSFFEKTVNRVDKRDESLKHFFEYLAPTQKEEYIKFAILPMKDIDEEDQKILDITMFDKFYEQRKTLIKNKLLSLIN